MILILFFIAVTFNREKISYINFFVLKLFNLIFITLFLKLQLIGYRVLSSNSNAKIRYYLHKSTDV